MLIEPYPDGYKGHSRIAYIVDPKRAIIYGLYSDASVGLGGRYEKEYYAYPEQSAGVVFQRMRNDVTNTIKISLLIKFKHLLMPES